MPLDTFGVPVKDSEPFECLRSGRHLHPWASLIQQRKLDGYYTDANESNLMFRLKERR